MDGCPETYFKVSVSAMDKPRWMDDARNEISDPWLCGRLFFCQPNRPSYTTFSGQGEGADGLRTLWPRANVKARWYVSLSKNSTIHKDGKSFKNKLGVGVGVAGRGQKPFGFPTSAFIFHLVVDSISLARLKAAARTHLDVYRPILLRLMPFLFNSIPRETPFDEWLIRLHSFSSNCVLPMCLWLILFRLSRFANLDFFP